MKANFICFKLSKMVVILLIVILLQIILICIEIKEMIEISNLEQIRKDVANVVHEKDSSYEMHSNIVRQ